MSDVMLYGVLRMPFDLAMSDDISRLQFYQRAQEAADRLERAEAGTEAAKATSVAVGELPPEWISDMCGQEVADLSYGQGYRRGFNDCRKKVSELQTEAARQPAPADDGQLKLICAGFGWRTDGDSNILADRIEHHIRDMKAGIKARDTVIAERDAALAATAAPVVKSALKLQPAEYDAAQDRHYLPLPGGWEIQTKGNGSTFRICHIRSKDDYTRYIVADERLHKPLEAMARDIREAILAATRSQP